MMILNNLEWIFQYLKRHFLAIWRSSSSHKKLTERKSSYNNAEKDLFVKILTGDKSDNIKGVFNKCGPKTACKYFDNKELFEGKLNSVEGAMERYLLNKKIIDCKLWLVL